MPQIAGTLSGTSISNQTIHVLDRITGDILAISSSDASGAFSASWAAPARPVPPDLGSLIGTEVYVVVLGTPEPVAVLKDTILSLNPTAYHTFENTVEEDVTGNGNDMHSITGITRASGSLWANLTPHHIVLAEGGIGSLGSTPSTWGADWTVSMFVTCTMHDRYYTNDHNALITLLDVVGDTEANLVFAAQSGGPAHTRMAGDTHGFTSSLYVEPVYHIVMQREGTRIRTYIDGLLQLQSYADEVSSGIGSTGVVGGTRIVYNSTDQGYQASDVAVWERILTQTEVRQIYEAGRGLTYSATPGQQETVNSSIISQILDAVVPSP